MKLLAKFTLSLLVVTCLMISLALFLSYKNADSEAKNSAFETCFKILASVEASRSYVREVLRPAILKTVQPGDFIPEAMSASFVARKQFEYFLKEYPDYYVKFASPNPRNSINKADKIETKILNRFSLDPTLKEWQGITRRNSQRYFTVAKPFRFKSSCMKCHSDPEIAPQSIRSRYGNEKGFWRKLGDVTMYSISVPIEITHADIWRHTFSFFIPFCLLIILTLIISSHLFRQMVSRPIHELTVGVDNLSKEDYQTRVDIQKSGELRGLAIAFNSMTQHLDDNINKRKQVEDELRKAHNHLEQRVELRTNELMLINEKLKQEITS